MPKGTAPVATGGIEPMQGGIVAEDQGFGPRGPIWVSLPLGALAGAVLPGALIAHLIVRFGVLPLQPALAAGIGGLFGFVLLSVWLTPVNRWSIAGFIGTGVALGNTVILGVFGAALLHPPLHSGLLALTQRLPGASRLDLSPGYVELAPLYLAVFLLFTIVAPVSLILMRYIALSGRRTS